jgi:predicted transcriptional regulator
MLDELFDGEAAPLVLQLMKTEKFSAEEIAELQKLIDQLDQKDSSPSRNEGRT